MDKVSWDIIDLLHIAPFVNHSFNVFINIYEYAISTIMVLAILSLNPNKNEQKEKKNN